MDDVYYKIYLTDSDVIGIVCLQWFDEDDYNRENFLSSKRFCYKSEAIEYLEAVSKSPDFGNLSINVKVAISKFLGIHGIKNCLDRVHVDWDY